MPNAGSRLNCSCGFCATIRDVNSRPDSESIRWRCVSCNREYATLPFVNENCAECVRLVGNINENDRTSSIVCGACCSHYACNGHSGGTQHHFESQVRRCPSCGRCADTCQCLRCITCAESLPQTSMCVTSVSDDRNRAHCRNCCRCSAGWDWYSPKDIPFTQGTNKRNQSKRFIAAEIETAGCGSGTDFMKAIKKWGAAIVRDGSISGFEINTSPASGDAYIEEINEIVSALNKQAGYADVSCGLHVHVDCRDFNYYDMRRLVQIYYVLENGLFALCQRRRHNGQYSKLCGESYYKAIKTAKQPKEFKKKFLQSVYGGEGNGREFSRSVLQQSKYNGARYNAMNLHSWMYRGTVENRMFHGTVDANDIINWGILNARMIDFAMNRPEKEVNALVDAAGGKQPDVISSSKVMDTLFPDLKVWMDERRTKNALEGGIAASIFTKTKQSAA